MTIERRKHRRCLLRGVAEVQVPGKVSMVKGILEDMSIGGIAIYTTESLPDGVELQFHIEVRTPHAEIIKDEFVGKVAWRQDWGGFILHGIAFDETLTRENAPLVYPYLSERGCL